MSSNFNNYQHRFNENPANHTSNSVDHLFTDDLDDLLVQATQQVDVNVVSGHESFHNYAGDPSLSSLRGEVATLRARCQAEEERNRELVAKQKRLEEEKNQQISILLGEHESLKTLLQFQNVQNTNLSFNRNNATRKKTSPVKVYNPKESPYVKIRTTEDNESNSVPHKSIQLFSSILKEPVKILSCVQMKVIDSELKELAHSLVAENLKTSVDIFLPHATKIIEAIEEYIAMQLTPRFSIAMGQKNERIELEGHALLLRTKLFDLETRSLSPYSIYDNHPLYENEDAIPVRRFIAILALLSESSSQFFAALSQETTLKLIGTFKKFTAVRNSHLYTGIYLAGTCFLCALTAQQTILIDHSTLFQLANAMVRGCIEAQSLERYAKFLYQVSILEDNMPFVDKLCNRSTCGYHLIDNITDNRFNAYNSNTCVIQLFASIVRAEYQDNPKLCSEKCGILFRTTLYVLKFLINSETFDAEWTRDKTVKGRWTCFNTYAFTTITLLHVFFNQFPPTSMQTKDDMTKLKRVCGQIPTVQRILKFEEFNEEQPYGMPSNGRHRLKDVNFLIEKYLKLTNSF